MKHIALIVTGTALLLASCGIASAASRTEGTMPNHVILPYPAELETKVLMLAPNTAYQLLNPVSPEQQVAKAEAREQVTRPQYTLSPEQQVARAEHVARPQYTLSPEQQVARAEHVAGPLKHATRPTSPVTQQGPPPAPPGWIIGGPCSDFSCSAAYLIRLLPQPSTPPPAAAEPPVDNPVGSGSRAVVSQTNVPQ